MRGLNREGHEDHKVQFEELSNKVIGCGMLVENKLIVELKSVEKILPIHEAQVLIYEVMSGTCKNVSDCCRPQELI